MRLDVIWALVAPTEPTDPSDPESPGYDWGQVDNEVEDLSDAGFKIMITVEDAPSWAEGPNIPKAAAAGTWEPNSADLGAFASAIATRYDGSTPNPLAPGADLPRISIWQPWNEPNLPYYLSPSWVQTSSGWVDEAAIQYRAMLDKFYGAVKTVSSRNLVVAAGTAPYGDAPGNLTRVSPVTFDQDLFCLNAQEKPTGNCPDPAEFDVLDHHPYVSGQTQYGPTWHAEDPDDVAIPDIYKLAVVLHAAEKAGTVEPLGSKQIWTTEIAWESSPPQPASAGVPLAEEGLWTEQALYELWSQGVDTVLWFELGDPAESSGGLANTYDDGLFFNSGSPKPAAQAFRFPFLTNRQTSTEVQAWGRAPTAGTLFVERKLQGKWKKILKLKTTAAEIFEAPLALSGSGTFRAIIGRSDSLAWHQSP